MLVSPSYLLFSIMVEEIVEQIRRLARAAAGFRMELHGERVLIRVAHALDGLVVPVDVADDRALRQAAPDRP